MKKWALACLVLALGALAVARCGSSDSGPTTHTLTIKSSTHTN